MFRQLKTNAKRLATAAPSVRPPVLSPPPPVEDVSAVADDTVEDDEASYQDSNHLLYPPMRYKLDDNDETQIDWPHKPLMGGFRPALPPLPPSSYLEDEDIPTSYQPPRAPSHSPSQLDTTNLVPEDRALTPSPVTVIYNPLDTEEIVSAPTAVLEIPDSCDEGSLLSSSSPPPACKSRLLSPISTPSASDQRY